jgi:rSAM/selenodomain-associated transferase 1
VKLLVIAKEPVPGRVKTRLCPPLRPEQAADLARAALADTLDAAVAAAGLARAAVTVTVVLDGSPGPWLPPGVDVRPQVAGPLEARLAAAFDAVRGEPALLIGMDTPQVGPDRLADALGALERADAVFGAALDGGWWALGLRAPDGALLRGVATSTPTTGTEQRERLRAAGLTVVDLPPLRDVDTAADIPAVARLAPGGRFAHLALTLTGATR